MYAGFLRSAGVGLAISLFLPGIASAQKLVTAGGTGTPPAVRVFDASGSDTTFLAYPAAFPGGVRVALGDVTGDGVLDIITGAGPGGGPHVRVWNGADLTEVGGFFAYDPAFPGGVFVAAGDVNGDGRADIITGAGAGGGPHVRIWDGATFAEIGGFFAYDPAFPGGVHVAAGDVDGDGRVDIVTGAGAGGGPHVRVWSGADFHEIGGFFAYDPAFPYGVNVAAGDIDGDGRADIVTGAGPGLGGGPHVRVWSGADFHELGGFFAYDPGFPGGVMVGTVDLDRDGRNELITGPAMGSPLIRLWTGTTFMLFGEYFAYDPALGGNGVFVGSVSENPSTDDAPRVASSVPANNATGVAVDADLTVTFSEAVTAGAGAFVLECPTGTPIALTTVTASPATTFTLHPTSPLPLNTSCTLRVVASQITDEDTDDPPDTMTANATVSFMTSACAPITVSPTTVPGGNVSVAYAPVTFTQVGGTAPITWTVSAGTLPTGMMLSPAGVLSGTPTQAGAFPLTITATATGGCTGSVSLTLNIAAGPNQAPSFTVGANQTVLEDASAQTVAGWATAISPGPPDEAAQTVTFNITGNTNAALFSAGPAVSPTGALTYTPAANANGTATITLVLMDNGGTALGGVDTSAPQTFTITVTAVNDVPNFAVGPNQVVLENAGPQTVTPWAIAISSGPANESAQTLTFNITGNTNPSLFAAGPAVSPTGTLTYTPAANTNGTATITLALQDSGGTANGGVDTSPGLSFTITVTGINSAPSFTVGPNQTILEDAAAQTVTPWATAISPGPADEAGQTVTFAITGNTNAGLFSVAPAVSPTGTLTYTPAANAVGTATITLTLSDDGGTAGGGVDTSAPQSFTITVTAVNDAPTFTKGADQAATENSGAHTVAGWATAISAGPANEAGQTLTFNVTGNTNAALFSAGPAVSSTGTLTYTLAPNTSGAATITLTLSDNGGTANGGVDTSAPQTFTITVTGVNSAPSFTVGANQTVLEDGGAQSVAAWATNIDPGGPDEAGQTLTFNITGNTNAALFSVAPAVAANGTLTYTPAVNASGTATITLTLSDNGGTANGGVDTSAPQTFTITVTAVNDAPSFVSGGNRTSAEDAGAQSFANWATAISAGPADEAGQTLTFVVTGNTNPALFSVAPAVSAAGTLTYVSAPNAFGSADITLVLQDNGGGVNQSAPVMFTITVTPVNDPLTLTVPTITYATAGNTQLHVAGAARAGLASIADASSILTKSIPTDIDGPQPPEVVAFSGATTSGTATLNADGSFTYVPNAGFTGTDSFSFQVTDGVTPVTGTIQITVTNRVWYVSNQIGPNNPANGDGRSTDAFETLALAETASAANDIIFVFNGDSQTTALGGITLKNGVKLHGEGVGLTVAPFGTIVPAGTAPRLTSAGDTIVVLANTANGDRTGVEIRGLSLASTGGNAIDVTSADAAILGVRISENTITGATAEGIDINHGSSGAATLAVHDNTITAAGTGLDITRTAGTVTITTFDDNVVSGATGGAGIIVSGPSVTFDATPGGAFDVVSGGTTAIGQSGNGVGAVGLVLSNVSGDLSFVDLNVDADNGAALFVAGTGPINVGAGTGTRLTAGGADLHAAAGPAVSVATATIDLQLASMSSTTATNGLVLTNVNGTFSAPSGSVITKSSGTGAAVFVDNSGAGTAVLTATYGGTVTNSSSTGRTVTINSADAGSTLTFTGAVTDNPGQGIALTGNTGATITFSGGLTLSTGANPGFTATGGGTIAVTGGSNTVNASGATAIDLTGVTIGGAGVTFQTTSSGGGTRNVKLTSVTGGAISLGTGALSGATGAAFLVGDGSGGASTGGTSTITYGGTITAPGTARAVDIQDRSAGAGTITLSGTITRASGSTSAIFLDGNAAGTITFSGIGSALNGGTSTAVSLTNNTGATINFTGNNLDIDATSGGGFHATGGGTVNVTGTGHTITTTNGTALNVANTTIGASGITFQSISAGTGAGSAGNGIMLDNTGTAAGNGGLIVTGTGAAASGGTIQHKTGANGSTAGGIGIYLNQTRNASFSWMQLNHFDNFAIRGNELNGLTLSNVVVNGTSGNDAGSDEGAVLLEDSGGTIAITNSNVSGGFEDNLRVDYNNAVAGPAATFNVSGSTFRDLQAAGQNAQVNLRSQTSAGSGWAVAFNFTSNTFENDANTLPPGGTENWSDGILVTFEGPFAHDLTVQNSTFHHLFQGMDIASNFSADVDYVILNNTITFTEGVAAIAIGNGSSSTAQSFLTALIQGNTIGTSGVAQSGSRLGQGIVVDVRGEEIAQFTLHGNTIRRVEVGGIDVLANTGDGDLNIQLTNNVIEQVEDDVGGGISDGIRVLTATGSLHDICLDARNNDSFNISADDLQLRQSNAGVVFAIEGLTGSGTSTANVEAFLDGQNPLFTPASGGTRVRTVASVVNYTSVAACTTPPNQ